MPIIRTNEGEAPKRIVKKAGDYPFEVKDATLKKAQSGNQYIELKLAVGEPGDESTVYDNLTFTESSAWKISQFMYSTELADPANKGTEINLEADDCLGLKGRVKLKVGKDSQKQDKNEVDSYLFEEF
jgi:hypothetical protein